MFKCIEIIKALNSRKKRKKKRKGFCKRKEIDWNRNKIQIHTDDETKDERKGILSHSRFVVSFLFLYQFMENMVYIRLLKVIITNFYIGSFLFLLIFSMLFAYNRLSPLLAVYGEVRKNYKQKREKYNN